MKITVDVECTPEEARRLMGLPDMAPVHAAFVDKVRDMTTNGLSPDMIETMMRSWAPMGEAGFGAWRQLLGQFAGSAGK